LLNVCFQGQSGKHLLAWSFSGFDPLQTTGFRLAATRRPRPRRSSISPNGQNQAVKEAPEQIVAQLNGGAAQAVGLAGPMNAPMKKTARRVK
jgi:ABC-type taurine transport system ATPase subunit